MSKQYPGGIISKTPVTPSGSYENSAASGVWTLEQQAYWQKLGQWPTAGNVQPDAQFNYVTMLLHGDGTNGAQNNTFLDSSTNNFTITRNGNTTQGSFSPYGPNWSYNFPSTNATLQIIASSNLAFGTGNYTFEVWFNSTHTTSKLGFWGSTNQIAWTGDAYAICYDPTTSNVSLDDSSSLWSISTGTQICDGLWHHLAVVRNSGTWQVFVDGVSKGTTTSQGSRVLGDATYKSGLGSVEPGGYDGRFFRGYMSSCRIGNTAVYTSNFTPSTTPLTAISGTQLLTCQNNRLIDNSANNFVLKQVGDGPTVVVQRFNPFGTATAYSTSVIGGSGYFDGTGDYLTVPDNAAFTLGTSNFTIEFSVYPLSGGGTSPIIFEHGQSGDWGAWIFQWVSQSDLYFYAASSAGAGSYNVCNQSLGTLAPNQWTHICVTRNGSTFTGYKNGTSVFTSTSALGIQDQTAPVTIGRHYNSSAQDFKGYVTDARIVVGSVVTPPTGGPTSPLTAVSNTALLTNMTNGAIFDNAMMNDLETAGNAQISTSVVKYGTGSLYFDGTGDALIGQNTPNISLSGNFTIEAWVYQTNAGQNAPQLCIGDAANSGGILLYISTGQQLSYFINGGSGASGTATINTWHHIAVVRSGSTITTYLNGVAQNIVTTSTTFSGVPYFGAGLYSSVLYYGAGYMDDLRITKGYARYTVDFTPPTAAFPNTGPT